MAQTIKPQQDAMLLKRWMDGYRIKRLGGAKAEARLQREVRHMALILNMAHLGLKALHDKIKQQIDMGPDDKAADGFQRWCEYGEVHGQLQAMRLLGMLHNRMTIMMIEGPQDDKPARADAEHEPDHRQGTEGDTV